MTDFADLRKKAREFREAKDYKAAFPLFKEIWEASSTKDKWDGWGYVICLNQAKDYNKAYQVAKEVYELDNSFNYILGQFAWASYMANIKDYPDTGSIEELEKFVGDILKVTESKPDDTFRIQSILKMMDFWLSKGNWSNVIKWAKKIDLNVLSTKDFKGQTSDGKNYRKPSDKESYFLKLTKALNHMENHLECIKECDNALIFFPQTLWFKWHKAVSLRKMKKLKESICLLEELKLKKKDWFILKDLAAAYFENGEIENSYRNFLEACESSIRIPDPQNRWELYYIGARLLYKLEKNELADKHISLVAKLREENGWQIQEFLQRDINERNIILDNSSSDLFKDLKNFWADELISALPQEIGTIKKFIQDGNAGFVKSEKGIDYYFKKNDLNRKEGMFLEGDKVKFGIQKSYDAKKKQDSEKAVFIRKA